MRRETLDQVNFDTTQGIHAGLWLEKYMSGNTDQAKTALVDEVSKLKSPLYEKFLEQWQKHLSQSQFAFNTEDAILHRTNAKVLGRLIVGIGGAGVLENSLSLHHTYGVPMIPGSALKGLCSSYAHRKLQNATWRKKTQTNPQGVDHQTLFGNTENAGFVTFLDALPTEFKIHCDVLTPHHQGYNGGDGPPADWDNPVPIPFLSCSGTFMIAVIAPKEWVNTALEILQLALREEGIGAKTSSGYGRMKLEGNYGSDSRTTANDGANAEMVLMLEKIENKNKSAQGLRWADLTKPKGQRGAFDFALEIVKLAVSEEDKKILRTALEKRVKPHPDANQILNNLRTVFEPVQTQIEPL